MALAEQTWERVGERKRDRARLIESAGFTWYHIVIIILQVLYNMEKKIYLICILL